MMAAMAKGYQVLGEKKYLASAEKCASFLQQQLSKENHMLRRYAEGEAKYDGTLTDYAYVIYGLQYLYEANFKEEHLLWAQQLQHTQDELFWDDLGKAYFTASKKEKNLIARKKDHSDGAIPAGNSIAAGNLLRFYHYFFEENYEAKAKEIFQCFAHDFSRVPSAYAMALANFEWLVRPVKEIAVVTNTIEEAKESIDFLQKEFLPRKVLALSLGKNQSRVRLLDGKSAGSQGALVYVCEEKTCLRPVSTLAELQRVLAL